MLTAERQPAVGARRDEWRQHGEPAEVPDRERNAGNGGAGERERWARSPAVQLRLAGDSDRDLIEMDRRGGQLEREPDALSLGHGLLGPSVGSEPECVDLDPVGTTDTDVLEREAAAGSGQGFPSLAGGDIDDSDRGL